MLELEIQKYPGIKSSGPYSRFIGELRDFSGGIQRKSRFTMSLLGWGNLGNDAFSDTIQGCIHRAFQGTFQEEETAFNLIFIEVSEEL